MVGELVGSGWFCDVDSNRSVGVVDGDSIESLGVNSVIVGAIDGDFDGYFPGDPDGEHVGIVDGSLAGDM